MNPVFLYDSTAVSHSPVDLSPPVVFDIMLPFQTFLLRSLHDGV